MECGQNCGKPKPIMGRLAREMPRHAIASFVTPQIFISRI